MRLVLIRHGATASNREGRYLGRTDEPLSPEGVLALETLRKERPFPPLSLLFSSPMKRCLQTARILYPGLDPVLIPEWTEMDFGDFEGKNYRELSGDARYQAWIDSGGTLPFPGGESREDFRARCLQGLKRMAEMLFAQGALPQTAGAIVHGGTIMALLSGREDGKADGADYFDYQVKNGQGYSCTLILSSGARPDGGEPHSVHSHSAHQTILRLRDARRLGACDRKGS